MLSPDAVKRRYLDTVAVEDQEGLKRVMFYGDWNPVRAGICDHPGDYEFSSYRYYAFGEVNGWTSHLTPPQWYIDLADTPEERQSLYRKLCDEYHRDKMLPERADVEDRTAFGSSRFMDHRDRFLRAVMARLSVSPSPAGQSFGQAGKGHWTDPDPWSLRCTPMIVPHLSAVVAWSEHDAAGGRRWRS